MSFSDKQQCLLNAASYYNLPHESRARAIGSLLNDPRMSIEWDRVWANTPQKELFRNTVLTVPLIVTQSEEQGGQMNYLDFFKNGGIHIKKANKGKFTEYCNGKVTEECIERGKHSTSAAVRKRATFAENARKWKH